MNRLNQCLRYVREILRQRWVFIGLTVAAVIGIPVAVFLELSQLPLLPAKPSRWTILTGSFAVLGALSATIAVVIAVLDRVRRERPQLLFQTAHFTYTHTDMASEYLYVNVGGGPAIRVIANVVASNRTYVFDWPVYEEPRDPTPLRGIVRWQHMVEAVRVDHGIGDGLIYLGFTRRIARDAETILFNNRPNDRLHTPRDDIMKRVGLTFQADLEIELTYTDRGGVAQYTANKQAKAVIYMHFSEKHVPWQPSYQGKGVIASHDSTEIAHFAQTSRI